MGSKKIALSTAILVIVAAILIVSDKMVSISPPEHRTKLFPALEERHVSALVIKEGGGEIRVERSPCGWKVGGVGDSLVKADSALAQIAVERIVSLRKNNIVSDNPANRARFEVEDDAASSVEIYTTDSLTPAGILLIGKNGPEWNSNYVRLKGADEVYLMAGNLRQALFFDIERWRKKEVQEQEPLLEDVETENDDDTDVNDDANDGDGDDETGSE